MKQWTPTNLSYLISFTKFPQVPVLEFQDNKGGWHHFDLIANVERIAFGGCCNAGFIESGYIERDSAESFNETLQELLSDLETYYNDGPQYVSRIVCNERM